MRSVRLLAEAETDVRNARDWYDRQRKDLGGEFLDEFETTIRRIVANPESFAVTLHDVRQVRLRRFPYVVYYRATDELIDIFGVIHGSRDPNVWQRRV